MIIYHDSIPYIFICVYICFVLALHNCNISVNSLFESLDILFKFSSKDFFL